MNDWTPEPLVFNMSADADIDPFLLSANWVQYEVPVDDPLFSAHVPYSEELVTFGEDSQTLNVTIYLADKPAVAVGCVEQFQLRNPIGNQTSTLSSLTTTNKTLETLGLNDRQQVTAHRSTSITSTSDVLSDLANNGRFGLSGSKGTNLCRWRCISVKGSSKQSVARGVEGMV
jgi:hypothetical protein